MHLQAWYLLYLLVNEIHFSDKEYNVRTYPISRPSQVFSFEIGSLFITTTQMIHNVCRWSSSTKLTWSAFLVDFPSDRIQLPSHFSIGMLHCTQQSPRGASFREDSSGTKVSTTCWSPNGTQKSALTSWHIGLISSMWKAGSLESKSWDWKLAPRFVEDTSICTLKGRASWLNFRFSLENADRSWKGCNQEILTLIRGIEPHRESSNLHSNQVEARKVCKILLPG